MDMEKLGDSLSNVPSRYKKRADESRGKEYKRLYLRLPYSITRDSHIRNIGAHAFVVYLVLRTYTNKDLICYPSLRTISYEAGISIRKTQMEIDKLVEHGWISKIGRRTIPGHKFGNNEYKILMLDLVRGSEGANFIDKPAA